MHPITDIMFTSFVLVEDSRKNMATLSPSAKQVHFRTAVDAIYKNWPALQLAVTQGAAGPQSAAIAEWMIAATEQWFTENSGLIPSEVAEFLDSIMNNEFNVVIDDGSSDDVAKLICDFYSLCSNANATEAEVFEKMATLPKCDLSRCRVEDDLSLEDTNTVNGNSLNSSNISNGQCDEAMDMDTEDMSAAAAARGVDPDGWTVVNRKKK